MSCEFVALLLVALCAKGGAAGAACMWVADPVVVVVSGESRLFLSVCLFGAHRSPRFLFFFSHACLVHDTTAVYTIPFWFDNRRSRSAS